LSSANRIPGQNPLSVDSGAGASDADGALLLNSRNAGKSAAALPARIQSTGLRGTAQPSESESLTVRSKAQITMASPFNTSSSGAPTMMKDATQTGDAINASFAATAAAGASISIVNAAGPLATAGPAIAAPLNSPQWPGEFGRQFIAIAQGAQGSGVDTPHSAELRLDPPELGPLRITININDNVAHAVFTSAHAAVRQTLENALPQLQQLLAQAGISLGQASVNDHSQPQSDPDAFAQADRQGVGGVARSADPGDTTVATTTRRNVAPNALIDTFA
jgi:flagellar hook-length control protein FliK